MNALSRSVPLPLLAAAAGGLLLGTLLPASTLRAQVPPAVDADLPASGEVWIELSPTFESWSEQFALGSDSVADGSPEPLHANFSGPVLERLYPGSAVLVDALNRGADSLGYPPLEPADVSLGSLDFRSFTARRTSLPLRAVAGVTSRLALEAGIDLVQTRTEAAFSYDSAAATVAPAAAALPEGGTYLDELSAAREMLEGQLEGGELSADQEAAARELLNRTGAFAAVLRRRLESGGLLPLPGSTAGDAVSSLTSGFVSGFQDFEIEAPELGLAATPGRAGLESFFTGPFMDGTPPGGTKLGLQPVRLRVGLRIGILDSFGEDAAAPAGDTARAGAEGLRLRTTAAIRARWPLGDPDAAPFLTPDVFMDLPAGPGTRVVEAALYQDVAVGAFRASAGAGYGRGLADELTLRVHSPDRPFALAGTTTTLDREPGDYVWARVSPRLVVNSALSLGGEYAYWHLGETTITATDGSQEGAADLGRETGETRHDVGVGVYYTAASPRPADGARPVEVAFTYRLAVAGSGGRTPSPNVVGLRLRVPVQLF